MERTDLQDTKPWVHQEIIKRLRELSPSEKFMMVVELSEIGLHIHRQALRRASGELRD
jgi:hypothetical protein